MPPTAHTVCKLQVAADLAKKPKRNFNLLDNAAAVWHTLYKK